MDNNEKSKNVTVIERTKFKKIVLNNDEYNKLYIMAKKQENEMMALLIKVLGETGIRYVTIKDFTVEAIKKGYIFVYVPKREEDIMPLDENLQKDLLNYIEEKNIESGPIFVNSNGKDLSMTYINFKLKAIAKEANIDARKVSILSFRQLFFENELEKLKNSPKTEENEEEME